MPEKDTPQQQTFDLQPPPEKMGPELLIEEPPAKPETTANTGEEMGLESLIEEPPAKPETTANTGEEMGPELLIEEPLAEPETTANTGEEMGPESLFLKPKTSPRLSDRETREIVTPYAFTVAPELLGQTLATPARRGVAILIDLFLISVLSSLSALIFAAFVALTFFKADKRLEQTKTTSFIRLSLRGSAAILIFLVVFNIILDLDEPDDIPLSQAAQASENEDVMRSLLDLAAKLIDISCKDNSECLLNYAEGVAIGAAAMDIPVTDINATTSDIVSQKEWSDVNKSLFMDTFINTLNEERNAYTEDILEITQVSDTPNETSKIYSIIEWIKGIMADLGLGLGWAALYFSVFTAWWRGQTIGKKLLGIEVVKLDGNYPSLWESFGRYGGYGAGFATGLLGFLQIYWDPNRQAIQDKISETLVLRLKPKR